jgi:predicted amidohydrolase YtcJ
MDGSPPALRRRLLRRYQEMARAGELTARIDLFWPLPDWQSLPAVGAAFGTDWVRIGGVKGFVDGSIGSSTAKMFAPYLNEPGSTGVFVTPPEKLLEYVRGADRAGLQVAVHAIGDRAIATLLDVYARVAEEDGPRDRRFRVEHAQHVRPDDFRRFHDLGVIASVQPYHAIDDGRWVEGRIGIDRCATSYALGSFRRSGVLLAFGSDWTVAPLAALSGIDAAVNRRTLDGKHPDGWYPEQRIAVTDAVRGYTLDAAYAAFAERDRGSIEPGKVADLVVLSRDILAPSEKDHIAETEVVMTISGGRVVYEKAAAR